MLERPKIVLYDGSMTPTEFHFALKALNLKQAEFARLAGINEDTVTNWKKRGTIPPMAQTIVSLLQEIREIHERTRR